MSWIVVAKGHPAITARHRTTFMITKELEVGPKGDCIIGVAADKAGPDLPPDLKDAIRAGRELLITLEVEGMVEKINAKGHPLLTLDHPTDLVVRKSKFICGRTLAIGADKAAADLQRKFVFALRNPANKIKFSIEVSAVRQEAYLGSRQR
jgi:hypothetical protein